MSEDKIKEVLRRMPYGWYVVTSRNGEDANAMVANWITQVSFEPRLLAFGLQKTSYSYGLVNQGRVFSVNLFLKEDQEIVKSFSKSRDKNAAKMDNVKYSAAPETGCPIIDGAAAYLECRVKEIYDFGGDHNIILGEVVGAGNMMDGEDKDSLTLPTVGWHYAG